jgi:hypothetical protein
MPVLVLLLFRSVAIGPSDLWTRPGEYPEAVRVAVFSGGGLQQTGGRRNDHGDRSSLRCTRTRRRITPATSSRRPATAAIAGTTIHRVVKYGIIQGGDPLSKDPSKTALYGTGGMNALKGENQRRADDRWRRGRGARARPSRQRRRAILRVRHRSADAAGTVHRSSDASSKASIWCRRFRP